MANKLNTAKIPQLGFLVLGFYAQQDTKIQQNFYSFLRVTFRLMSNYYFTRINGKHYSYVYEKLNEIKFVREIRSWYYHYKKLTKNVGKDRARRSKNSFTCRNSSDENIYYVFMPTVHSNLKQTKIKSGVNNNIIYGKRIITLTQISNTQQEFFESKSKRTRCKISTDYNYNMRMPSGL